MIMTTTPIPVTATELRQTADAVMRALYSSAYEEALGYDPKTDFTGTAEQLEQIANHLEAVEAKKAAEDQLVEELAKDIRSYKYPSSQSVPWERSSFQKLYRDTARGLLSKYDITPKPAF